MNCEEARELLLVAEPVSLRGEDDSPLAAHLAACASCEHAAGAILAQQASLQHALSLLAGDVIVPTSPPVPAARPHRRLRRALAAVVPLAAAAALVVLLTRPDAAVLDAVPTVNGTTGDGVAVMETSNPDITVYWQF